MGGPDGSVPSKISQRQRKTNTVWSHLYVELGGGKKRLIERRSDLWVLKMKGRGKGN